MSPITILISEDAFLLEREIKSHLSKIDPAVKDFNFDQYSAKSADIDTILQSCDQLPMMTESRFVWVSEIEALKGAPNLEKLERYFSNPSPTTQLLITGSKVDKRIKPWNGLNKKGAIKELKSPYANEIPQWLDVESKKLNLSITRDGSILLQELVGNNLMALYQALLKLEIAILPAKKIERTHVDAVIGDGMTKNVFDFADKVGSRDLQSAFKYLGDLVTKGEESVMILALLIRHFRLLMICRENTDQRGDESSLAGKLGVSPFFVKNYLGQSAKYSLGQLKKFYARLLETDRALKSSRCDKELLLDKLILQA